MTTSVKFVPRIVDVAADAHGAGKDAPAAVREALQATSTPSDRLLRDGLVAWQSFSTAVAAVMTSSDRWAMCCAWWVRRRDPKTGIAVKFPPHDRGRVRDYPRGRRSG